MLLAYSSKFKFYYRDGISTFTEQITKKRIFSNLISAASTEKSTDLSWKQEIEEEN